MNKTTSKLAYKKLKGLILECELKPSHIIFEKEILEKIKMGRTPVREAIQILQGEGLLKVIPKKGIQISPISISELVEIYQIRRLLEPYALKESIKHLTEKDKEYLSNLLKLHSKSIFNDETKDVFNYGGELHIFIAKVANNKTLLDILIKLREKNYRGQVYYYQSFLDNQVEREKIKLRDRIAKNHSGIIEGMLSNNFQEAYPYLLNDIETTRDLAINSQGLKASPARMIDLLEDGVYF